MRRPILCRCLPKLFRIAVVRFSWVSTKWSDYGKVVWALICIFKGQVDLCFHGNNTSPGCYSSVWQQVALHREGGNCKQCWSQNIFQVPYNRCMRTDERSSRTNTNTACKHCFVYKKKKKPSASYLKVTSKPTNQSIFQWTTTSCTFTPYITLSLIYLALKGLTTCSLTESPVNEHHSELMSASFSGWKSPETTWSHWTKKPRRLKVISRRPHFWCFRDWRNDNVMWLCCGGGWIKTSWCLVMCCKSLPYIDFAPDVSQVSVHSFFFDPDQILFPSIQRFTIN